MKEKLRIFGIVVCMLVFGFSFSQENQETTISQSENKNFTNKDKKYNDWSVSVLAGGNLFQSSDLASWGEGKFKPGYDFKLQLTKQVTHAFGIMLSYEMGKTNQFITAPHYGTYYNWEGRTKYHGISLLGDLNLSMLFRRIDNNSPFNWALHAYAGVGLLGYKAERIATNAPDGYKYKNWLVTKDQKLNDRSVYFQFGTGLMRKLSHRFDIELRAMYILTGDEEFDASGRPDPGYETLADFQPNRDDRFFTVSLGLHYKIGKHKEHLRWVDPLKHLIVPPAPVIVGPCEDDDNDGVCNAQDKCPDTPEGIRVDGAGCPLDSDNDGVPDSIDQCPTIPGPPTNNGCPIDVVEVSVEVIGKIITQKVEGIEFEYNSSDIRPFSYPKLNEVANILDAHPNYKFYVEGHTDAAGSAKYNLELSERRAASVVRYLINKGVNADQLVPVGKGESDLRYPECDPVSNCPPWKNLANRRVVFKPYDGPIKDLDFVD